LHVAIIGAHPNNATLFVRRGNGQDSVVVFSAGISSVRPPLESWFCCALLLVVRSGDIISQLAPLLALRCTYWLP
jgi:hypothetical protein